MASGWPTGRARAGRALNAKSPRNTHGGHLLPPDTAAPCDQAADGIGRPVLSGGAGIFPVTIRPGLCKTEPEGAKPLNEHAPWIEDHWPTDAPRVRSIVLVLHGGQARSPTTVRRRPQLSYLRMVPFARFLHRREGGRGLSVRILRYRYRGGTGPSCTRCRTRGGH